MIIIKTLIIIITFFFMEFVAWFTHKYIMHGFLWALHKDHHQVDKDKTFQKNDYFFLIFAIPSIIFFVIGSQDFNYLFFIGLDLYWISILFAFKLIESCTVCGIEAGGSETLHLSFEFYLSFSSFLLDFIGF